MTKYLYDHPERASLWSHEDVLDTDIERTEYDKNFNEPEVYNSILDDEPAYHSLMNFPEDAEDALYTNDEENIFDDRDAYKEADQDDIYYFI